ncbi:hypothetical protein AAON49_07515 [Pseudotenacibaculum sp. MALMAid0570]|uniref:hypothetical protein n=1 Tax=Pseudotenacibaculum sp. MALMAid0570 TaxID=3143938 RepID=UPI0032DFE09B
MKNTNFLNLCMMIFFTACGQEKEELKEDVNFNPPTNIEIKRTYAMSADGYKTGKMEAVRKVDTSKSTLLIKDIASSLLSFNELNDTKVEEVFWLGSKGIQEYYGEFTNVKTGEITNNKFKLEGNILNFESKTPNSSKPYKQSFERGKDYHTATIYINPTNREMEPGKEYKRKMLDVSFARTMKLKEKFLRMDTFTLGKHTFDCHVIYIDYGHLHGEVWLAKDELGWFLIYEKATATEGSFELKLDSYEKTKLDD